MRTHVAMRSTAGSSETVNCSPFASGLLARVSLDDESYFDVDALELELLCVSDCCQAAEQASGFDARADSLSSRIRSRAAANNGTTRRTDKSRCAGSLR